MKIDRLFQCALLISACTHSVILFRSVHMKSDEPKRDYKMPLVEYIKAPEALLAQNRSDNLSRDRLEPVKMAAHDATPPPFTSEAQEFVEKESHPRAPNVESDGFITKPVFDKTDAITTRKKITLPMFEQEEKIDNPEYVSYYQTVRERIKRSAYRAYSGKEQGEVMLSFIVTSGGQLKAIRLVEEKSSSSEYLRSIADRSVRSASPFPPFPKEVNYVELSFNIAITFEVE